MSIDFQSRQVLSGTENITVNLTFFWKSKKPGRVKVCGAEIDFQCYGPGEKETNNCPVPASEDEVEQNCSLAKLDVTYHETGIKILSTVANFRYVFALNDQSLVRNI